MTEMTLTHPRIKHPWILLSAGVALGLLLIAGIAWLFGNVFRPYPHGMLPQSHKATDFC
jgi:hypothetical protein